MKNPDEVACELRAQREDQTEQLLDKKLVASRIRISVRTLDNWIASGRVSYLKIGKCVRFRWSAVVESLERFRVG
jgi:excisionase family DNA binding protein